jgi:hypothetical protein
MIDPPFNVAGGAFSSHVNDSFSPLLQRAAAVSSSRRRRLWEIPHKFHCPVIGVCFDVDQLRNLLSKALHFPRETTDYVLHTTAVGTCDERSTVALLLHRNLEKRFQLTIKKFAAAKTSDALADLWRVASKSGSDIPGALWACWTHPACDSKLEQEIFADIHMIQHQVGTGIRADLMFLKNSQAENARLRAQLEAARHELETMRSEKSRETRLLGQRIAELRADLAGKEAWCGNLTGQLDSLRQILPDLKDRQVLARRANDAEARASAVHAHATQLESELGRYRGLLELSEHRLQTLLAIHDKFAEAEAQPATLGGKNVLCVGGRSGAVENYRQIVEERGGRFMHHDGGLEESLHRIDSALATADIVICQAGCISHNAYWRVKEQCKRTGKPCIFVKNAGISSFERLVSEACDHVDEPITD